LDEDELKTVAGGEVAKRAELRGSKMAMYQGARLWILAFILAGDGCGAAASVKFGSVRVARRPYPNPVRTG